MFIHIYVYKYMYIYIYKYAYKCIYIYIYTYKYLFTEWMALIDYGEFDEKQVLSYIQAQSLHSSRDSVLGNKLKESTIRRVIVIVYTIFFFLSFLIYKPIGKIAIHGSCRKVAHRFGNFILRPKSHLCLEI
jgi:hypothetical protein